MQLEAKGIHFQYTRKSPVVLQDLSLSVKQGERLGIVAPSGYGKTTLVKILSGYEKPTKGSVLLDGKPLPQKGISPVQLISQHPEHAINPRWKLRRVLEEAGQLDQTVLEQMGIEPAWLDRYPAELSGGELQRFCVARALCAETRFLIADEMSTMLDMITQAQIWHFLLSEAESRNLGLIVVTHNPALAEKVCTRVQDLQKMGHCPPLEDPA